MACKLLLIAVLTITGCLNLAVAIALIAPRAGLEPNNPSKAALLRNISPLAFRGQPNPYQRNAYGSQKAERSVDLAKKIKEKFHELIIMAKAKPYGKTELVLQLISNTYQRARKLPPRDAGQSKERTTLLKAFVHVLLFEIILPLSMQRAAVRPQEARYNGHDGILDCQRNWKNCKGHWFNGKWDSPDSSAAGRDDQSQWGHRGWNAEADDGINDGGAEDNGYQGDDDTRDENPSDEGYPDNSPVDSGSPSSEPSGNEEANDLISPSDDSLQEGEASLAEPVS